MICWEKMILIFIFLHVASMRHLLLDVAPFDLHVFRILLSMYIRLLNQISLHILTPSSPDLRMGLAFLCPTPPHLHLRIRSLLHSVTILLHVSHHIVQRHVMSPHLHTSCISLCRLLHMTHPAHWWLELDLHHHFHNLIHPIIRLTMIWIFFCRRGH